MAVPYSLFYRKIKNITKVIQTFDASNITVGTIDGDRLPEISQTKKGAVPATGYPIGKFLRDDGIFAEAGGGSAQGVMELDGNGDLMPRASGTGTEVMELDGNGDIEPKG
jgi:hypothetical protein